ncbi:hybrid sensor histidine kinase/response regulator [Enterovibrio nigricans]|uniref:histidine kinase n=1 Tax=Enterovibrio nigricans DSM 22720 TaxID=1121868 RepID=A0A1T4U1P2_9GAMM|nr:NahK/ErcS family hybrid sensor histidine kinase/response regulator [Enterovibrio nigricans]SKA46408.1 PAS domain S-box-containing protein [Enterovibrio nigricans DSM 22720]
MTNKDKDLEAQIAVLKAENERQKKMIDALVHRVEQGSSTQVDAWGAFQHSVVLADQVRDKTEELNHALQSIESTNRQLSLAKSQAEQAHQRFIDAIESISDGFALYGPDRELVYSNSRFQRYWQDNVVSLNTSSLTPEKIRKLAKEHGLIVQEMEGRRNGQTIKLQGNRWLQVKERETSDGGLVMLYSDITQLKLAETARFEAAMAEKSRLLQAMVDNLSQGVLMVSKEGAVQVFNQRFLAMSGFTQEQMSGANIDALMADSPLTLWRIGRGGKFPPEGVRVQTLSDGRVIEVRSHAMDNADYVNTYTDITQRYLDAKELRETEQWLRLITDNVPALIAYVGDDLHYQFTNRAYDQWYGFPRGELVGKHISFSRSESKFAALKPYVDRALSGESVVFEIEEIDANGQPRYVVKSYVPNQSPTGKISGLFVLNWDITERRQNADELERAYQTLELRVQERTAQLQALNDQLKDEVEERRIVQERLLETKQEAERANLSKTKFLATISHDLLQPLNAAQLYLGSLLSHRMSPSARKLVTSLSHSLEDVESLITTLVEISKLDAGVVRADKQSFPIRELLDNIADDFIHAAEGSRVDVRYVASSAYVYTDSQLLARIVRNLMTNALRYTHSGKILLGCRRCADGIRVDVLDTGVGIPEDKKKEIFQEFKRLTNEHDHHHTQLGLGLAIVDKIATVLGHTVWVDSVPDIGSRFSVLVPYGNRETTASPSVEALVSDGGVMLQGARAWVVDNDHNICHAMEELLKRWGCEVTAAASLQELQIGQDTVKDPVELLIVDYHLDTELTGLTLAQMLNAQRMRPVPTVIVTANRSEELQYQARELGYMVLHKPVSPMRLKMTLIHMLSGDHHDGELPRVVAGSSHNR